MNKPLSLVLLSSLGDLPYITKKTGVVQVIDKPFIANGETYFKKIPVSTLATSQECSGNDLSAIELIPDAREKGILYFEESGINIGVRRSGSQQYRSDLRLVCWLNTVRISGSHDMILVSEVMNQIINKLTNNLIKSPPFHNIAVTITRIPAANANIFGAYDYDEKRMQYLMSPYDFFALDLSVTFDLSKNCIPDIPTLNLNKCATL